MTIGGCNLFMGAYAERMAGRTPGSRLPISEDREKEITNQVTEAWKQIKSSGNKQDSVSISEEGNALLCSVAVADNMHDGSALVARV